MESLRVLRQPLWLRRGRYLTQVELPTVRLVHGGERLTLMTVI